MNREKGVPDLNDADLDFLDNIDSIRYVDDAECDDPTGNDVAPENTYFGQTYSPELSDQLWDITAVPGDDGHDDVETARLERAISQDIARSSPKGKYYPLPMGDEIDECWDDVVDRSVPLSTQLSDDMPENELLKAVKYAYATTKKYVFDKKGLHTIEENEYGLPENHKLADFAAIISCAREHSDGYKSWIAYKIDAYGLGFQRLKTIWVRSAEFESMNWLEKLQGALPTSFLLDSGERKKVKEAILLVSKPIIQESLHYQHFGWGQLKKTRIYLTAHEYIEDSRVSSLLEVSSFTNDGESVPRKGHIPKALTDISFSSPKSIAESVHASISLVEIFPEQFGIMLLALVYLAPIGEMLGLNHGALNFTSILYGQGASSVAKILQSHWGSTYGANTLDMSIYDDLPKLRVSTPVIK